MDAMRMLDELVSEVGELRPFPMAAARVLQLTESGRFSAHELAETISADPVLTAQLLRLANSAYYGFPRRIGTVQDAAVLLGFRAVRSVALASSVIDTLGQSSSIDRMALWRFSVAVGTLADVLARARNAHRDEAFTAGVLHNVGLLMLDQQRTDDLARIRRIVREQGVPLPEAEREVLGFSDAQLARALALHWNFPEELAEAISVHDLDNIDSVAGDSLAALVVSARRRARADGLPDGVSHPQHGPAPTDWREPVVVQELDKIGGMAGVRQRVEAFIEVAAERRA